MIDEVNHALAKDITKVKDDTFVNQTTRKHAVVLLRLFFYSPLEPNISINKYYAKFHAYLIQNIDKFSKH